MKGVSEKSGSGVRSEFLPQLELLEERAVPAAYVFTPSTGTFTVNMAEISDRGFGMSCSGDGKLMVQGFLSETDLIIDYIEQTQPGKALLPKDPFARAKVRELAKEIELYIELPGRACYGEAFFGSPVPEAIKEKTKAELLLGFAALGRHGKFAPYVAGDSLSIADLYFLYSVPLACAVGKKLFDLDLLAEMPKAKALLERLEQNPHVQKIAADKEAAMPAFLAMIAAKK